MTKEIAGLTPDQQLAERNRIRDLRTTAMNIANSRAEQGAKTEDIVSAAEKVLAFLTAE